MPFLEKFTEKKHFWSAIALFGVIICWFSVGFHHPDEHFSVIELFSWKEGLTPWETFRWDVTLEMRPFLLPALLYAFNLPFKVLGISDPFVMAFLFRLLSFAVSSYSLYYFFKSFDRFEKAPYSPKLLFLFTLSIWFVPYLFARASSENWANSCFLLSLALLLNKDHRSDILCGLCFAFSFFMRFQMAVSMIGVLAWILFIDRRSIKSIFVIGLAFLLGLLIGALFDYWGYGHWTLTPWNYFRENLLNDRVNTFGRSPFYFYISKTILKGIPPLSLLLIGSTLAYFWKKPKSILSLTLIPFVLVHSLIGHKEVRFLFFVYLLSPFFLFFFLDKLKSSSTFLWILFLVSYGINFLALTKVVFTPAQRTVHAYNFINQSIPKDEFILTFKDKNGRALNLEMPFYNPSHQKLMKIKTEDLESFYKQNFWIITSKYKERLNVPSFCQRNFTLYPEWLLNLNFFGWRDRSSIWTIYHCRQAGSFSK